MTVKVRIRGFAGRYVNEDVNDSTSDSEFIMFVYFISFIFIRIYKKNH